MGTHLEVGGETLGLFDRRGTFQAGSADLPGGLSGAFADSATTGREQQVENN